MAKQISDKVQKASNLLQAVHDRKELFLRKVAVLLPQGMFDKRMFDTLDSIGFFAQAASTRFHGAYVGGLFDHSLCVMVNLIELTKKLELEWERPESPAIVGMFHDLCKADQYSTTDGKTFSWVKNTELQGHGDKSVILLSRIMPITKEEATCIRYHMGAFSEDKDEWRGYTDAIHSYQNVLWTHTADMMASHIDEI